MRIQATLAYAGAMSSQFEPTAADGDSESYSVQAQLTKYQTLQRCGSCVAAVWQWCGSGVAAVWQGCGSGVAGVWQRCGSGVAVVWQWCGSKGFLV